MKRLFLVVGLILAFELGMALGIHLAKVAQHAAQELDTQPYFPNTIEGTDI